MEYDDHGQPLGPRPMATSEANLSEDLREAELVADNALRQLVKMQGERDEAFAELDALRRATFPHVSEQFRPIWGSALAHVVAARDAVRRMAGEQWMRALEAEWTNQRLLAFIDMGATAQEARHNATVARLDLAAAESEVSRLTAEAAGLREALEAVPEMVEWACDDARLSASTTRGVCTRFDQRLRDLKTLSAPRPPAPAAAEEDFDPLTAPIGEVDAFLRAEGMDPDEVGRSGAEVAAEAMAKRGVEPSAPESEEA